MFARKQKAFLNFEKSVKQNEINVHWRGLYRYFFSFSHTYPFQFIFCVSFLCSCDNKFSLLFFFCSSYIKLFFFFSVLLCVCVVHEMCLFKKRRKARRSICITHVDWSQFLRSTLSSLLFLFFSFFLVRLLKISSSSNKEIAHTFNLSSISTKS